VRELIGHHAPRLGVSPKAVLEYAVVHELAHLRHRDHTPAFWRAVGEVVDDYELRREWLATKELSIGYMR
jgi:predicted metal-dependent hydrolase